MDLPNAAALPPLPGIGSTTPPRMDGAVPGAEPSRLNQATTTESSRSGPATGPEGLTEAEQRKVEELKRRDREVRQHEAAHKAAAGELATGSPRYTYEIGPDGNRYAVAGEVQIASAKVPGDPEATIQRARKVAKAALAPADPSQQDMKVAAEARRIELEARQEVVRLKQEETAGYGPSGQPRSENVAALLDITI